MRNGVKNSKKTQFSSTNQPSGNAKSQGWERRRQRQAFMDQVSEYMEMDLDTFEKRRRDMEESKQKYTLRDKIAFEYVEKLTKSRTLLIDFLDRHLGKPPIYTDMEDNEYKKEKKIKKVVFEFMPATHKIDENDNVVPIDENDERNAYPV